MYNKIWLMVPTFKRVEWLKRFIDSAVKMVDDVQNIQFCICVNKKDTKTLEYINSIRLTLPIFVVEEKTVQPDLSLYFNMMYNEVTKLEGGRDFIASMLGDDMVFETRGYDTKILNKINEYKGVGVFWCDDGYIAHDRLCVNLFVTKRFIDGTGKPFMCPMYKADMIDVVWFHIGELTQTKHYINDVIIHHYHSTGINKDFDNTFQRLIPLQQAANNDYMHKYAQVYASIVAGNLISIGYGEWSPV